MRFEEIQNLKKEKSLIINNINFSTVMATRLYPDGFLYTIKCLLLSVLFRVDINYINNYSNILISYTFEKGKRKDQDYIIEKFRDIIKNYNEINIEKKITIIDFWIELKSVIKKTYLKRNLKIRFIDKLRVAALENYFEKILIKLEKIDFKEELYISFCDSYLEENLFAQHFNNKKMITATLQHGQYRYIKKGYETTDVEAYLSFVSDYLFSWGEVTKFEFLKASISEERILNVGALKEFSERDLIKNNIIQNKFGLILNGETHSDSNIKMIQLANEIAKKYSMEYYIRPHPMNKFSKYKKYIDNRYYSGLITNRKEYGKMVDFSILHMTAVFVEMLSQNLPFFVFDDEWTESIFKIDLISFKNLTEFNIKYSNFINDSEKFLEALDQEYHKFNCCKNDTELVSNYLEAIEKIFGRQNSNE